VPAEVRQRFDKLEQKDLPGVISTASTDRDDEADNDNDNDDDGDADDNDSNEPSESSLQQVSYRAFPRSYWTLNSIVI
jgi:cobalamin biosynthesis protein CobT